MMLPKMLKEQKNQEYQNLKRMSKRNVHRSATESAWSVCAKQVLQQNGISLYCFASALRQLLEKGRQKGLNVLLIGPTNCGKSFLLNPLELIYKTFKNPPTGKYAWTGLDEYKVAYLNDFL